MAKVIYISEQSIGEAWLSALTEVLCEGDDIKTEYDKPDTPPSKDATVLIEVKKPMSKPIKRKDKIIKIKSKFGNSYEVYGVMADTFLIGSVQSGYIEEILEGVHDHYLWDSSKSFPYSYHDRIYNYAAFSLEDSEKKDYIVNLIDKNKVKTHEKLKFAKKVITSRETEIWKLPNGLELDLGKEISEQIGINNIILSVLDLPRINQIDYIINKLKDKPYTRRAQATTWRPYIDPYSEDPPCLQRLFFRVKNDELILQTCWRSRDLFRAWEANVNGMVRIQKYIADKLNVGMGHYLDFSNSLHIYGDTVKDLIDMFKIMENRNELQPKIINKLKEYNYL